MSSRLSQILLACSLILASISAQSIEFRGADYNVYIGDVNGDGINDVYLKVPDVFVLIHGDISVPLLIDQSEPSYLVASVDVSSPYYAEPVIDETIDESLLVNATDDASLIDLNGDGIPELQISSALLMYGFSLNGVTNTFVATSSAPPIDPNYFSSLPTPAVFSQPIHNPTVGALGGEYTVGPDGSAGYTIPLDILGGRDGIVPNLSINYNNNGPNGALGVGWTVSGLSAVLRCPNNSLRGEAVDPVDFDSNDKFCLDGVRLVVVSGNYGSPLSEYRKENDDGTKVIARGAAGTGPLYFEVITPEGLTHYYGSEIYSRILASGRSEVRTWALNRTKDRYSNYLNITYTQPSGSGNYRPSRIDYTGNINASVAPTNSVRFFYNEGRSDKTRVYMGGAYAETSWVMDRIEIYAAETQLRKYKLSYSTTDRAPNYHLLKSVQKCSGSTCLNPTTIEWSQEEYGIASLNHEISSSISGIDSRANDGIREQYVDLNNDGYVDRIWNPHGSNNNYYALINNGSGFSSSTPDLWQSANIWGANIGSVVTESDGSHEWYVDINSDGLPDRVWVPNTSNDNIYWAKNSGSGFIQAKLLIEDSLVTNTGVTITSESSGGREAFIDMNGDGLVDRIWRPRSGQRHYYVSTNTGSGNFAAPKKWMSEKVYANGQLINSYSNNGQHEYYRDMNGDGLVDRFWLPEGKSDFYVALNNGTNVSSIQMWLADSSISTVSTRSDDGKLQKLVDLNADGLPDWIWNPRGRGGIKEHYYAAINNGKGFNTPSIWLSDGAGGVKAPSENGKYEQYVDVTGDGLPDRVWRPHQGSNNYYVATNTGSSFSTPISYQHATASGIYANSHNGQSENFIDINGDGSVDRIWEPDGANNSFYSIISKPNYRRVEKIIVGNGDLGNTNHSEGHITEFHYKPAIDNSVVTRSGSSLSYPYNYDLSPRAVVHKVTTSNGLNDGGVFTTNYSYKNPKIHVNGYGNLGFGSMTTTNAQNSISTTTTTNQSVTHKTHGLVSLITTTFGDVTLSTTHNTWTGVSIGSGNSARNRVELKNTNIVKRDLNGAFLSSEKNTYTYNEWGAPKTVETKLFEENNSVPVRTKSTAHEYTSFNSTDHILPLVEETRVSVQVTGRPVITIINASDYYPTGKKWKEKQLHPATLAVLSETEYHNIDAFGHHLTTTTRGSDFSERSTSVTYDASGRYMLSATNALGHTSTTTYYPDSSYSSGLTDVVTSVNGIKTKNYYDVFGRPTKTVAAYQTTNPINSYMSYEWCSDIASGSGCSHVSGSEPVYRMTSSTDGGAGKHVFVDRLGREVKTATQGLDGRYINVLNHYDIFGRNNKVCDPFYDGDEIVFTHVQHDALGRVIRSEQENGVVNTVEFNGLTRISRNDISGKNQNKTEIRDVMDNLVEVVDNDQNSVTYKYDSLGKMIEIEDAQSNITTIEYDQLGRKKNMNDLDKGFWSYSYNNLGELVSQTNARGETSCVVYDKLGRMTRRYDHFDGSVSSSLGLASNATNNCANAGAHAYYYWNYDSASGKSIGQLHQAGSSDGKYLLTNFYDGEFGRIYRADERIDGITYRRDTSYDQYHRIKKATYPGVLKRLKVESVYNNLGYQIELRNADNASDIYHSLIKVDAQGNTLEEILGNGVKTVREFDLVTNRIKNIKSWLPTDWLAPSIQELDFEFDVLGNLELREDRIQNFRETFEYDSLNRLTDSYADFGNADIRHTEVSYDAIGNIKSKTGVGSYSYGATCNGVTAGPHAVTSITSPKSSNYCYDHNGNMISGDGRTIQYSAFDKPISIQKGNVISEISYGPDRNRYKRIDTTSSGTTTYHYVGGLYERLSKSNGDVEERSFIGGLAIYSVVKKSDEPLEESTNFLHKDHLGSVTVITDSIGRIREEFSFDPWGKRRAPSLHKLQQELGSWGTLSGYEKSNLTIGSNILASAITNQGFTGHEQLDGVGLIHMNGRVYDAELGRFISADPFVQDRTNLQALNRYSYVQNNPLSYTDPSGYFLKNIFKKFVKEIKQRHSEVKSVGQKVGKALAEVPWLASVVGIIISVYCPPCGAMYFQYLALVQAGISYANGASLGESIKGYAVGMATSMITGGIAGGVANASGSAIAGRVTQVLMAGVVSKASGGKFIDGVKSAVISLAVATVASTIKDSMAEQAATIGETKADSGAPTDGGSDTGGVPSCKPINLATGEKYLTMRDYASTGASKMKLERFYSSYKLDGGSLGKGWRTNFDKKLELTAYRIAAVRDQGDTITFTRDLSKNDQQWKAAGSRFEQLHKTESGWELVLSDNSVETYDADGRLVEYRELNGYHQVLVYSESDTRGSNQGKLLRVDDNFGQSLAFEYERGRMTKAFANGNLLSSYQYDDFDNLVKVFEADNTPERLSDNPFKRYQYTDSRFAHALTRIENADGETLHNIAYDAQGRAIMSAVGGMVEVDRVNYSLPTSFDDEQVAKITTFTNPLGRKTIYRFDDQNKPLSVQGHATASCIGANQNYQYNDEGLLVSKVDWNGTQTQFEYNDRGLEITRIEAFGTQHQRQTQTVWHKRYRLPVKAISEGKTTVFNYNMAGLLTRKVERDTTVKRTLGERLLGKYNQREWQFSYNERGLLSRIDGPRDDLQDITRYEYDEQGNQITVINALGHRNEILERDSRGLPLVIENANNIRTRLTYDARGWLVASENIFPDGSNDKTHYSYKLGSDYLGNGLVETVTLPNGASVSYEYDRARRVIAQSNHYGERIEYKLDALGNRVEETIFDMDGNISKTHKRVFDELSRLLKTIGAHGETLAYRYDTAGNRDLVEDALGNKTHFAYDALNRLIATADASGNVETRFDSNDRVTHVVDQRGLVTEYHYNGFGDKISQISPDTGTAHFIYDKAGNLVEKVDARQVTTQFVYDALNRVTDVIYPAANDNNIHYVYDAYQTREVSNDDTLAGSLTEIHDVSGHTYYAYNARGQVIEQSYAIGESSYQLAYNYSIHGELESIIYPSGRVVNYDNDERGRLAQVGTSYQGRLDTVVKAFSWDAFGPVSGFDYGNGSKNIISRDLNHRVTGIKVVDSAANDQLYNVGVVYDLAGNIGAIADAVAPYKSQSFTYDDSYRLIRAKGQYGEINYAYDGVGNRLNRELLHANTADSIPTRTLESYTYAQDSNRLLSVARAGDDGVVKHRHLNYDSVGNIVDDTKYTYGNSLEYGVANRLEKVEIGAEGKRAVYTYNAKGQRVSKIFDGVTTHFHYDITDRLIAETTLDVAQEDSSREYIYAAGQRVAMINNTEAETAKLLFVVNDHLGTPQMLIDEAKQVVWQMNASPFGEMALADSSFKQSLRFPGQYADVETGYSYNYFRDYDPSLGRYIQSDPIGLLGGVNTFGYVHGNPISLLDPNGLAGIAFESGITIRLGGIFGQGFENAIGRNAYSTGFSLEANPSLMYSERNLVRGISMDEVGGGLWFTENENSGGIIVDGRLSLGLFFTDTIGEFRSSDVHSFYTPAGSLHIYKNENGITGILYGTPSPSVGNVITPESKLGVRGWSVHGTTSCTARTD